MTTKNKCLWTMTGCSIAYLTTMALSPATGTSIPAAIMSVVCSIYIAIFIAANLKRRYNMRNTKGCPLLTYKAEYKALMVGTGDTTIQYLLPCIKDKCVAYEDGYCKHFDNKVKYKKDE